MLGPVDLLSNDYLGGCINCEVCLDNPGTCVNCAQNRKLDWIICGCETGRGARPTNIEWIRGLKNQCVAAGVPFFLKQMEVNGKVVKMPELDGQRLEGRP
jgi:protein gp37